MYKLSSPPLLVAAISLALLSGCKGEDGAAGPAGPAGPAGESASGSSVEASAGTTTSGFVFPADAIFVEATGDNSGSTDITSAIQIALFEVVDSGQSDATIVLPKGRFEVNDTILIDSVTGLTLTGYGINETHLDFSHSVGDDGFRFEGGTNITVRDLSVYEAPKNAIKVTNSNGVHMAYTGAIWEGVLDDSNGAYGLYPLQSTNILMEHNYARGSADAGIYVGQSKNIVVRHNTAKENVAGIEVENSFNADVYNNLAIGNTGGVLVFDLPGLDQAYGGNVRVFNNTVYANNAENFAGGGAVGIVPPGTGALIFATSNVEVYNNEFTENETAAIEIASYFLADDDVASYVVGDGSGSYEATIAKGWSPLLKNISVHNNTFARNGANPRGPKVNGVPTLPAFDQIVAGYTAVKGEVFPNILYGGIGELLSNADQLSAWDQIVVQSAKDDGVDHDAYSAEDQICVDINVNANNISDAGDATNYLAYENVNVGVVYGTNPLDPASWVGGNPANGPETPLNSSRMDNSNRTLQMCANQPVRLQPAEVEFRGKVYGCNGDDLAEVACAL